MPNNSTRYPLGVSTDGWGAFGTGERDHIIDRERRAWSFFSIDRMKKGARRGVTPEDVFTGGLTALVQILFARMDDMKPSEDDRQKMHQALDYVWLNVEAHARDIAEDKPQ